jgi:hypothetical protein
MLAHVENLGSMISKIVKNLTGCMVFYVGLFIHCILKIKFVAYIFHEPESSHLDSEIY